MTSKVQLWNLALSHIGNKAGLSSASAPYDTREAQLCGQYYDIARQMALSKVKPLYARRRVTLALVDLGDDQPDQWEFAYARPSGIISLVGIYDPNSMHSEDAKSYEFETAGADDDAVIYTNVETAIARVIFDVEDVDAFSPPFVVGLSWLLASFLAGALIKGVDGVKVSEGCEKKAWAYLGQADTDDANQKEHRQTFADDRHMASWINARGFGADPNLTDSRIIRSED